MGRKTGEDLCDLLEMGTGDGERGRLQQVFCYRAGVRLGTGSGGKEGEVKIYS